MPEFGRKISGNDMATSRVRKDLTEVQRSAILAARAAGVPRKEVALDFGISPKTVTATVNRWETYKTLKSLPRSGRPEKLSAREKRYFNRKVRREPRVLWKSLLAGSVVRVCKNTARKALNPEYRRKWQAKKTVVLTEVTARKRLAWATYWRSKATVLLEV